MLNSTKQAKNRRFSMFFAKKITEQPIKSPFSLDFIRENKGTLSTSFTEYGATKVKFTSETTGKKAHAFGKDFHHAYQNMVNLFNLKYNSHGN